MLYPGPIDEIQTALLNKLLYLVLCILILLVPPHAEEGLQDWKKSLKAGTTNLLLGLYSRWDPSNSLNATMSVRWAWC